MLIMHMSIHQNVVMALNSTLKTSHELHVSMVAVTETMVLQEEINCIMVGAQ